MNAHVKWGKLLWQHIHNLREKSKLCLHIRQKHPCYGSQKDFHKFCALRSGVGAGKTNVLCNLFQYFGQLRQIYFKIWTNNCFGSQKDFHKFCAPRSGVGAGKTKRLADRFVPLFNSLLFQSSSLFHQIARFPEKKATKRLENARNEEKQFVENKFTSGNL